MKKFLKWMGFVVLGLVGILFFAAVYIYFASEAEFDHRFDVAAAQVPDIPTDPAEIAAGERLARIRGCHSCHGADLSGAVPVDIPHVARFTAPNITGGAHKYTNAELVSVIRTGVRPDGKSTWLMPSGMFAHMSDAELGQIVAYVRSVPPRSGLEGGTEMRALGRMIVAKGDFLSSAREVAALAEAKIEFDRANPVSHGRYLVMNACSECHAQDLKGREVAHAPTLDIVKGYSREQFERLMREGVGTGERTFALMTPTAKERFSYLSADEVAAMYAFLHSRS